MTEREFTGPDGRTWYVRERLEARREDGVLQVALELDTEGERRVVTCSRLEWEVGEPDCLGLLARSVPGGASRGLALHEPAPPPPQEEPDGMAW